MDKRSLSYKGRSSQLSADLSTEAWQVREGWNDIFKVLNEKKILPIILYSVKLSFRMAGQMKSFKDKQKLKEFVNPKLSTPEK